MATVIHPTAVIDPRAEIGPDCRIGPYAILEGPVRLGAGNVIRPHTHLIGPLEIGDGNDFGTGCVIGDRPQHLAYDNTETRTVIGHRNVFREHVTVHRPMPGGLTSVGDQNFFMVGSHVGHDARVGNHCILANHSLLAGHVEMHDRAFMSGNSAIHQHCRIGTLALISGTSGSSMDVPPYWIIQRFNIVCGVNLVGMRRAGIPNEQVQAVRKAFKMIYLQQMMLSVAVNRIEEELGQHETIRNLVDFIRTSKRGVCGANRYDGNLTLGHAA